MKLSDCMWRLAARLLSHPHVTAWLIRHCASRPYYHLDGYMDRWWLTPRFLLTRDQYGNLFPYDWLPMIFKVRLHHIKRPDQDRHKHDHPADNRSIILRGMYEEQDVMNVGHIRRAGDTVFRRAECFHRISYVPADGVWTLWWRGDTVNEWGFLVDGRKIGWRTYLGLDK
jgi:hypothetical protein